MGPSPHTRAAATMRTSPPLLLLLACSTALTHGMEVYCPEVDETYNDNPPFDSMPLPECPDIIQISQRVYTRQNRDSGQVLTSGTIPPVYDGNKEQTIWIVHGWTQTENAIWMHNLKDALLDLGDYNVIVTGWQGGSQQLWYPQSASDTQTVGTYLARTAELLVQWTTVTPAKLYCTGHSLGSHVCGHTGNYYAKYDTHSKMGRITGLDPAGPWFENKDWSVGINPGSGDLVDIMHTNGEPGLILALGTMKVLGHVDFFPAGGGTQPGCILDPYNIQKVEPGSSDMRPVVEPACSHLRAVYYYIESVKDAGCFKAHYKCNNQYDLPGACTYRANEFQAMGFPANQYSETGIFYMDINPREPYCMY